MSSLNSRLREFFSLPQPGQTQATRRIVMGLAFFLLLMFLLSADFLPDKVSLEVGQVSDRDVVAPRALSYVNPVKTKKLEMEVLASVANVYDLDVGVQARAEETAAAVFRSARGIAADGALTTPEDRQRKLQENLRALLPGQLPATAGSALLQLDAAASARAEELAKTLLRKYYQRGIRDDDLTIVRRHIVIETEETGAGTLVESAVAGVSQSLLQPNFILNVGETEKRKKAALAGMEPVRETVKKGQVLVRRGDVVTIDQIHAMEEVGLYRGHFNELRIFGLAIFVLAVLALILVYLQKFVPRVYENDQRLILLGIILTVTLLMAKAAHFYSDFVAPMAAGGLLTAALVDMRVALVVSVAQAILFGIVVDFDLRAVLVALFGSMAGVYSVTRSVHGYSLTRTGLWVAAVNFLVIGSSGFIEQVDTGLIALQGLHGIVGGVGAAVITMGLLPYLENTFNIVTPLKLLDLAKPNHPLLQRLLLEAPGTYHHSIVVGNLAEAAADLIGADPVTVRVGAYYHDIGKIKRPYFFVENLGDTDNPHDKIAPSLSTLIVTSHIRDGVELCRDYRLPGLVTDLVQQHHGTMLVSYFYKRAAENERGECVIEADFRYDGPTPQTKEAALIMLADACEAAVRSLSRPNVNRIEATVRKIIRERLHDGQLDDCDLTLRDLKVLGDTFIRLLSSSYHSRVEYPDALKELERRKGKSGNSHKHCTGKDDSNGADGNNGKNGCRNGG